MHHITRFNSNQLIVVAGEKSANARMLKTVATFAIRSPIDVLDGGNQANAYFLAAELRRATSHPTEVMKQIYIARAFTCYQMTNLLEEISRKVRPRRPVFILDLLFTFYDESVSHREARSLLEQSISCLQVISRAAPVIASARPPNPKFPEREFLYNALCDAADQLWEEFHSENDLPSQPKLF